MNIQDAMPNDILAQMWSEINWEEYENTLALYQRDIALAAMRKSEWDIKIAQKRLVNSIEAKALAVRHVCGSKAKPGLDRVKWTTDEEKMKAANTLNPPKYVAQPTRMYDIVQDNGKERHIQIPCYFDRAMHTLYAYALDPVCESTSDRKSFYCRKGRSTLDVHAYILQMFSTSNPPCYVVKTDVKACYGSISHTWLMHNIPMDKAILYQFLKVSHVVEGKLFPNKDKREGIAVGFSISPILCNITLNGMQSAIYHGLHDRYDSNIDYTDGDLIRYADDIFVAVRSWETAQKVLQILTAFLFPRGLCLSGPKTQIIRVSDGFEFIGRHYRYVEGIFIGEPSEAAISQKKQEFRELIVPYEGGQKALIDTINKKLTGLATYHRCSNAEEAFKEMDIAIKTFLLELGRRLHPSMPSQKIADKYFYYTEPDGTKSYALENMPEVRVHLLENTILTQHRPVNLLMNPYVDTAYYEKRTGAQAIRAVTGRYRSIWERQAGCCYYCGEPILPDHEKRIVLINPTIREISSNQAYVHEYCSADYADIDTTESDVNSSVDVCQILTEIKDDTNKRSQKNRFYRLSDYFHRCNDSLIKLTFSDVEKILEYQLCESAYTQEQYWSNCGTTNISKCWRANNYRLKCVDLKKRTITFERREATKALMSVDIPAVILYGRVPENAKIEIETYIKYVMKKYGLHKNPDKWLKSLKGRPSRYKSHPQARLDFRSEV